MKFIYLAAGDNETSLNENLDYPKCLSSIMANETVIDYINAVIKKIGCKENILVGGFKIDRIIEKFHNFKFFYNKEWHKSNSLYSLSLAQKEFNDDLIVSYSDIVYDYDLLNQMVKKGDFVIAVDSHWQKRYHGRTHLNYHEADKVYQNGTKLLISKKQLSGEIIGEFVGVFYIKKNIAEIIRDEIDSIVRHYGKNAYINELVTYCSEKLCFTIDYVDVKGKWAELDNKQDLVQFKFGTKADTLKNLEKKITKAEILPQYSFTIAEYMSNKQIILDDLVKTFNVEHLVIRSSALNEDSIENSLAGNYLSVLDVPLNENSISGAIDQVIKSYGKNGPEEAGNQVLVQPQMTDVCMNGVAFTKNINTGAPYYTINYEYTDKTDTITSGMGRDSKTFVFYKQSQLLPEDRYLKKLILVIREIEEITLNDQLDIEFAVTHDGRIIVFQVRPLAALKNAAKINEAEFGIEIDNIKRFIEGKQQRFPDIAGCSTIFGVMPDWNPAEIIGINATPLAFDLYKYLITDEVWGKSREAVGYRSTLGNIGIHSLAGKPYVDVRMSFNSLIPASLPEAQAEKMVDYFLNKLKEHPEYHDKIEYLVVMSVYDFNMSERLQELFDHGFNEDDVALIRSSLLDLSSQIINERNVTVENELNKLKVLELRREKLLGSKLNASTKLYKLLEDCKTYGTFPFSILARFSFISTVLLKSLVSSSVITQTMHDDYLSGINTVAKDFLRDLDEHFNGHYSREDFIKKYGHLRPGTYDIGSRNYSEAFDEYIKHPKLNRFIEKQFIFENEILEKIDFVATANGMKFNSRDLLTFIRKSIEARERAKFEFTKNLNEALKLMCEMFIPLGIDRKDIGYLSLEAILKMYSESSSSNISNEFKKTIHYNKKKYRLTKSIQLPELIIRSEDVDLFHLTPSKPNFVTENVVNGPIVYLNGLEQEIEGKIVLIENADPGYDWIFSHNILGLITKYGGIASHMAIRCAEFQLPAAIGCGELIFESLKQYKKIQLDCSSLAILGLR